MLEIKTLPPGLAQTLENLESPGILLWHSMTGKSWKRTTGFIQFSVFYYYILFTGPGKVWESV